MKESKSIRKVKDLVKTCGDDPKKMIRELKRLIREERRSGDYVLVGAAYCRIAEACNAIGDLDGLLSNALKAVALLKDSNEYEWIAKSYTALGQAYTNRENHQLAFSCDKLVYEIVRRHRIKGDLKLIALNNLSASYHVMGDLRKSIRYLVECIDLLREDPEASNEDLAMYLLNLSQYRKDNGEGELARDVFQSMAPWIDGIAPSPLACDYYIRSALLYYAQGDREAGDRHTDAAFSLMPKDFYPLPIYDDLRELSHFLSQNGDRARAETVLGLMTVFAEKNKGTFEQIIALRTMADSYLQFGDYKRSAEYYARYEEMNEKHLQELQEMQMKLYSTTQYTELEIRKLKLEMRKNEELVSLEPLTKLLNRSALLRVSSEFIESAAKKRQKVGAIFIDIDCFKECNDTYGHAKGDEIIKEVARACKKQENTNVRFARYGGDEYFGITRGLSDGEVCEVARRIAGAVRAANIPHEKNPNGGVITLSVGVVNVPITDKTNNILEISSYADKAVYYAKNKGKNAIYQYLLHGGDDAKEPAACFAKVDF